MLCVPANRFELQFSIAHDVCVLVFDSIVYSFIISYRNAGLGLSEPKHRGNIALERFPLSEPRSRSNASGMANCDRRNGWAFVFTQPSTLCSTDRFH